MAKARNVVAQLARPIREQEQAFIRNELDEQTFFTKINDVDSIGKGPQELQQAPDDVPFEVYVRYRAEVDYRSWGIKDIDYSLVQATILADGETVATLTPKDWTVKFSLQGSYAPMAIFINWNKRLIEFS